MPQCLIIDPCLFRFGGHEYTMDEFLTKQAIQNGFTPIVLCNDRFIEKAEFPYQAIFHHSPYVSAGNSALEDKKLFIFGNKDTHNQLHHYYPIKDLEPNSLVLIHTACATILGGIARWLLECNRRDIRVRIVLRWGVQQRHSSLEIGTKLHQKVFGLLQKCHADIRYFMDSNCLKKHFNTIFSQEYILTPIGVDFAYAPLPPPPQPQKNLSFVFTGTPITSKGGLLLADAILQHIQKYPEDTFVLHICGIAPDELEDFRQLPSHNVCLVEQYLNGLDYFNHILSADVALIPYSPQFYFLRTSHILLESLGMGRAVITSQHPWMVELMENLPQPCGVSMTEWSVEGLVDALDRFHERSWEYRRGAHAVAPFIQNTHNAQNWWNIIIS